MPLLTISSPGTYHITADYTCGPLEDGIVVNPGVHYVTIFLYSRLVGAGGAASQNAGIRLRGNADVKIISMGGSIRGFQYGICGEVAGGVPVNIPQIHGISVLDATFRGIRLDAEEPIVQGCDVRNVGGCNVFPNAYCMGIEVQGYLKPEGKPSILRNTVRNIQGVGTGESVGISISDKGVGGVLAHNTIINPAMLPGSFGVWIGGDSDVLAFGNGLDTWGNGIAVSSPPSAYIDENAFKNCLTKVLSSTPKVVLGPSDLID